MAVDAVQGFRLQSEVDGNRTRRTGSPVPTALKAAGPPGTRTPPCKNVAGRGSVLTSSRISFVVHHGVVANVGTVAATVLFCTDTFWDDRGDEIVAIDPTVEVVRLVGHEHITPGDLERITVAYFSPDTWPERAATFMGTCVRPTT